jgi:hypothetical protein
VATTASLHIDSQTGVVDNDLEQLKSASGQPTLPPSQNEPDFGDSSGRFFSIYSRISEEEDKKMTDRWQTDADSMLIFVSPCVGVHKPPHIN